jgi:hypothetical protein
MAEADREYERQSREEERSRQLRRQAWEEASIAASISLAMDRGEQVDVHRAITGGGIGRTVGEAISFYAALSDAQDAQASARAQIAYRKWVAAQGELHSGDTSVSTLQAERAEEDERRSQRHRNQAQRGRAVQREAVVEEARRRSFNDTARTIHTLERLRSGH